MCEVYEWRPCNVCDGTGIGGTVVQRAKYPCPGCAGDGWVSYPQPPRESPKPPDPEYRLDAAPFPDFPGSGL